VRKGREGTGRVLRGGAFVRGGGGRQGPESRLGELSLAQEEARNGGGRSQALQGARDRYFKREGRL